MGLFESTATAFLGVILYDWLSVTSSAARLTSFEYEYLPLSKHRRVSIALLSSAVFLLCLTIDTDNPPIIPRLVCGLALVFWCWVAVADVFEQRRRSELSDEDGAEAQDS